ncbi:hypothetical protein Lgee_0260 [Legionella geestiana]|uniref:Uncharacterized protein n=2 Tax=Legionella geestiana TaxID=45065 RepID=A0A0W0U962_9GAMM|nr:hypothetical protein [Legionella geestiana]KTD04230.1 hypothetical protein Lgee_0260 [Legionella geestiana]STX53665.1 Uncharacterised protein [Legionella geestiana]
MPNHSFFSSDASIDELITRIRENDKAFTRCYFDNKHLSNSQFDALFEALSHNTVVTYVNLFGCGLEEHHLRALKQSVENNPSIHSLILEESPRDTEKQILIDSIKNILSERPRPDNGLDI